MCERRRPPEAVERRDKRGGEEYSEADPAQAATEEQADRAVDLGADRRHTKRRIHVDSAVVLPDGRTILKEVRRVDEITTLKSDQEFKEFLEAFQQAVDLESLKSYTSKRCQLIDKVCELDPNEVFNVRQLREIFDLAK